MWWCLVSLNKLSPGKIGNLVLSSVKHDGKLPNGGKALPSSPLLVAGSGAQHNLGGEAGCHYHENFFSAL